MINALLEGVGETQGTHVDEDVKITGVFEALPNHTLGDIERQRLLATEVKLERENFPVPLSVASPGQTIFSLVYIPPPKSTQSTMTMSLRSIPTSIPLPGAARVRPLDLHTALFLKAKDVEEEGKGKEKARAKLPLVPRKNKRDKSKRQ